MNKEEVKESHDKSENQEKLIPLMAREVSVLREILASMHEEQLALLENDTETVKIVTESRETLMENLYELQEKRGIIMNNLAEDRGIQLDLEQPEKVHLSALIDEESSRACEIFLLRDQLACLMEKIADQVQQNNYLIQSKIVFTKSLLNRLRPPELNPTYTLQGAHKAKNKTTTLTLINQEV